MTSGREREERAFWVSTHETHRDDDVWTSRERVSGRECPHHAEGRSARSLEYTPPESRTLYYYVFQICFLKNFIFSVGPINIQWTDLKRPSERSFP